uniref:Phospholipase A1 n=1 Tax=Dinoponera quadriceps TaxID=609295 RepID=PA1_DINQU|nr:RecName: Full=Phospholipase A1; Short=PLA1; AltName: Full=Venom allergen 1; Flags: Precursor [Dinoponera quadriceps]
MKFITAILVIFCVYLLSTAGDSKILPLKKLPSKIFGHLKSHVDNTVKKPLKVFGHLKSHVENSVGPLRMNKLTPNCIFGVKSMSMVLFTKNIPDGKYISLDSDLGRDLDLTKTIYFTAHGFISNVNHSLSNRLSRALVEKDYTVFSLDWSDAACTTGGLPLVKLLGYPSAVQNTREIGNLMADYVMSLIDHGASLRNMAFIGHSLGSHVCGFASKKIYESGYGKVPLLFAADPAQPLFQLKQCPDRLCDTDAKLVITLHTSQIGLGYPIGGLDLYFNGGFVQPKCHLDITCAHIRSVLYLINMVEKKCSFPGIPATYKQILNPFSKFPYPNSKTTDCFVMDDSIFNPRRKSLQNLAGGIYYMFVDPDTFCTRKNFNCQR